VPTHDPKTMAAAIVALLRDPERRARLGAAGLARVRDRFTVERMVLGTLGVYERAIRELTPQRS